MREEETRFRNLQYGPRKQINFICSRLILQELQDYECKYTNYQKVTLCNVLRQPTLTDKINKWPDLLGCRGTDNVDKYHTCNATTWMHI